MSKPFNFYETITGLIYPEGAPTPFGLFYINSSGLYGIYFPQDIALGAPLHLLNDGDTYPTNFKIKEYGSVDREFKDIYSYSITPSGTAFPAPPDFGNIYTAPSGNMTGVTPDNVLFNIPWVGNLDPCIIDVPVLGVGIIGKEVLCPLDNYILNINTSGQITNYKTDINNYSVQFRGNLIGGKLDIANVNMQMYSISFAPGIEEISTNTGDLADIQFIINTISFKRAE